MILDETQEQRDAELADILGLPLATVQSKELLGAASMRFYDARKPEPTTAEEMEQVYRDNPNLDFVGWLRTVMYTSAEQRPSELTIALRQTSGQRCLDYGCGVGTHAIALAERGNDVTMLDVHGPVLAFAIKRAARRGHAVVALSHTSPLEEAYYDFVICSHVIEHVFDPVAVLERIHACLKPGGLLHLFGSDRVAPEHGHFASSVVRWLGAGQRFVRDHFRSCGDTMFRKPCA